MKNSLSLGLILSGLLLLNVVAFAQDPDLTAEEVLKNTVAASSNMHGCDFPRLDKENRAYFRLYSPDVKRLQIDICGKKYEMNKDENGWWTVNRSVSGRFPLLLLACGRFLGHRPDELHFLRMQPYGKRH